MGVVHGSIVGLIAATQLVICSCMGTDPVQLLCPRIQLPDVSPILPPCLRAARSWGTTRQLSCTHLFFLPTTLLPIANLPTAEPQEAGAQRADWRGDAPAGRALPAAAAGRQEAHREPHRWAGMGAVFQLGWGVLGAGLPAAGALFNQRRPGGIGPPYVGSGRRPTPTPTPTNPSP